MILPPTYLPLHLLKQPQNLEYLTLKTALNRNELPGVVFLVRSYPKLNTITFILQPTVPLSDYTYPFKPVTDREDFWKVDDDQPVLCFQLHLRVVKIENFRGSRNEFDLLRFFLREAKSLRKVILCPALNGVLDMTIFDEYVSAARQVESFERKSNFLDVIIE
ncbi:hypothetical protein H6P81_017557 [Aristolochia fimbriata]|uniref:FBD domain-containing protein n=1 Tax=Aristolochia fimbriata TaxID=158543 RepID=A0AAV7DZA3_ARIFI|nr:hypothetical protein H6P81_017557 [Aristolochia fimbriata]